MRPWPSYYNSPKGLRGINGQTSVGQPLHHSYWPGYNWLADWLFYKNAQEKPAWPKVNYLAAESEAIQNGFWLSRVTQATKISRTLIKMLKKNQHSSASEVRSEESYSGPFFIPSALTNCWNLTWARGLVSPLATISAMLIYYSVTAFASTCSRTKYHCMSMYFVRAWYSELLAKAIAP